MKDNNELFWIGAGIAIIGAIFTIFSKDYFATFTGGVAVVVGFIMMLIDRISEKNNTNLENKQDSYQLK